VVGAVSTLLGVEGGIFVDHCGGEEVRSLERLRQSEAKPKQRQLNDTPTLEYSSVIESEADRLRDQSRTEQNSDADSDRDRDRDRDGNRLPQQQCRWLSRSTVVVVWVCGVGVEV